MEPETSRPQIAVDVVFLQDPEEVSRLVVQLGWRLQMLVRVDDRCRPACRPKFIHVRHRIPRWVRASQPSCSIRLKSSATVPAAGAARHSCHRVASHGCSADPLDHVEIITHRVVDDRQGRQMVGSVLRFVEAVESTFVNARATESGRAGI